MFFRRPSGHRIHWAFMSVLLAAGLTGSFATIASATPSVNATNLFLVSGGRLGTPTAAACPEGITRGAVLDIALDADLPCDIADFSLSQFYAADEVFVTGTMGGLAPVIEIDGRTIGDGAPGPVTRQLMGLFADLAARSGTAVV